MQQLISLTSRYWQPIVVVCCFSMRIDSFWFEQEPIPGVNLVATVARNNRDFHNRCHWQIRLLVPAVRCPALFGNNRSILVLLLLLLAEETAKRFERNVLCSCS